MKISIMRAGAVLLCLAVAASAQDPLANTGGSTAIGSGAGTSAPRSESVRIDPITLPPTGSAKGGTATPQAVASDGSTPATAGTATAGTVATVATGTTAGTGTTVTPVTQNANVGLSLISGNGSIIVPRDGGSVQRINADGTRQAIRVNPGTAVGRLSDGTIVSSDGTVNNANGSTTVGDANGTTILGSGQLTNTNGAGPVIQPANPLLTQPNATVYGTTATGVNSGSGAGTGFSAGGIAPSGPRIEAAMSSQPGAGSVVPSGPRVETQSAPTTTRSSIGTAGFGSITTGGTVGAPMNSSGAGVARIGTGGATTGGAATGGAAPVGSAPSGSR